MSTTLSTVKANFGTLPVFLTAISTILGAVMFLRFGFAVGSVGFIGALSIILIGHVVTISTAMALAEIATNQKVEGGGEYFIISRSFGINIGAAIGIALYLSQAISVAFYVIAFGEAFDIIKPWVEVLIRTIFYLAGVFIILVLEKSFEARHEYGGFIEAVKNLAHQANFYHVWANTICVLGALLVFNIWSVIKLTYGKGVFRKLMMSKIKQFE
jgi:hypothetical protein